VRSLLATLFCFSVACSASDYRDQPRAFTDDLTESPVCDAPSQPGDDCEPDATTDSLFVLAPPGAAPSSETFVDSVHRKGDPTVTIPFLFYAPPHPTATAAVILFAGSNGLLKLSPQGVGKGATNFVVRTRHLYAAAGFCTVLVDAPSDHPHGLGNGYRTGSTEAKDLAPVIDYVAAHCHAPIWLVGTSRGTISAANIEARLGGASIAGVISTSSITVDPNAGTNKPSMATLYDVPLGEVDVPVQFMHHHQDGCPASPYDGAGDRFTGVESLMRHLHHAPITTLAPVSAAITEANGSPCGPVSYHGYWKLDDDGDVVPAIIRFVGNPQ
jgi:hypothetical protein